jgi:hypothetical protein
MGNCFGMGGGNKGGQRLGASEVYHGVAEYGGAASTPDRDTARQNALAAAEARQKEGNMRGVQGNRPQIGSPGASKSQSGGGRTNQPDFAEKGTWN